MRVCVCVFQGWGDWRILSLVHWVTFTSRHRIKKSASSEFFSEGQQLQLLAHQAEKIARLDREQGVEQGSSDGRQKKRQKTETWEKPSK